MMSRYKWIVCAALVLGLAFVLSLSTKRETESMESVIRYANGELLTFSTEYHDGSALISVETANSVPRDASVHYTLDGSTPTEDSPLYEAPVSVSFNNDFGTLPVIRAAVLYRGDWSDVYTKTLLPDIDLSLPENMLLINLTTDPNNLYDHETGIFIYGKKKADYIAKYGQEKFDALPTWSRPANFKQRGDEWVRDAYVEIWDSEASPVGAENIGISISGGASSYYDIKSLKLTADWQGEGKFPSEWFPFHYDAETLFCQANQFNKITLKNGGQDRERTYLISDVIYPLATRSGLYSTPETVPAVVYINGEFYSYMYACQHINRDYLSKLYGVDQAYIEWSESTEDALLDRLGISDMISESPFGANITDQLEKHVDVDNLLLYYAFEMVINNHDSMRNNYGIWRYTGEYDPGNPYTDGRYRFVLYDVDTAFRTTADMFDSVLSEDGELYSPFFVGLMKTPEYREKFITIVLNLTNSTLSPESLSECLNDAKSKQEQWINDTHFGKLIESSLPGTADGFNTTYANAVGRKDAVTEKLRSYFDLEDTYSLSLSVDAPGSCISIENMETDSTSDFTGTYFADSAVTVTAQISPGQMFDHWLVNGKVYSDAVLRLDAEKIAGSDAVSVRLFTKKTESSALIINEISAKGSSDWIELKNVGSEPIDLSSLFISNKKSNPLQCRLPSMTMKPGEIIVLNCKNNMTLLGYLVNFNLSDGETIYISKEDKTLITSLDVPKMADGKSYGMSTVTGKYVFFAEQTKGRENCNK